MEVHRGGEVVEGRAERTFAEAPGEGEMRMNGPEEKGGRRRRRREDGDVRKMPVEEQEEEAEEAG